jgi:hypothetical protein
MQRMQCGNTDDSSISTAQQMMVELPTWLMYTTATWRRSATAMSAAAMPVSSRERCAASGQS